MIYPLRQKEVPTIPDYLEVRAENPEHILAVYYFSRAMLHRLGITNFHDKDDLSQETILRVMKKINTYEVKEKTSFLSWIAKVVQNLVISDYRRKKFQISESTSEQVHNIIREELTNQNCYSSNYRDIDEETLAKLKEITLNPEYEELVLHTVRGLKYREISDLFELPIGTILCRAHRQKEKARKTLEGLVA